MSTVSTSSAIFARRRVALTEVAAAVPADEMVRLTLLAIAVTRLSCAIPAVPVGSSIISQT